MCTNRIERAVGFVLLCVLSCWCGGVRVVCVVGFGKCVFWALYTVPCWELLVHFVRVYDAVAGVAISLHIRCHELENILLSPLCSI